jgi:hypothetical protein
MYIYEYSYLYMLGCEDSRHVDVGLYMYTTKFHCFFLIHVYKHVYMYIYIYINILG